MKKKMTVKKKAKQDLLRVLIIDDELANVEQIMDLLEGEYAFDYALDGNEGLQALEKAHYGLILLDLEMPRKSGLEILQTLRDSSSRYKHIPIIVISWRPWGIHTLDLKADDFIDKPFEKEKLLVRIRAVLERRALTMEPESQLSLQTRLPAKQKEHSERIWIDDERHVVWIDQVRVRMTPIEFRLLALLLQNQDRVLKREQIIERLETININDRTIDCHIKNMRSKLGKYAKYLQTVHGIGYCFSYEINS